MTPARPNRGDAADYYFTYIDQVPEGDVLAILGRQVDEIVALREVAEERSTRGYAPGKWSLRQVVAHVNDTERVFAFRAMWFARGLDPALPSFDQDIAVAASGADERPLGSHIDEFIAIRSASSALFGTMPEAAWTRRGVASDNPFTVGALAFITAGHVAHHLRLIRQHYL